MKNKENRDTDISDLADRILAGDTNAETELYNKFSKGIFYIIKRKDIPTTDADELTQDVLNNLILRCRQIRITNPTAYIIKICKNKCFDYFHKNKENFIRMDTSIEDPSANPLSLVISDEELQILQKEIQKLSAREKIILHSKFFEDLSSNEIGARSGLKEANVRKIMQRALRKLKARIQNFIK